MNLSFDIGEDMIECAACGHVFHYAWYAKKFGVIAVQHFPVKCPECNEIKGYRIEDCEE